MTDSLKLNMIEESDWDNIQRIQCVAYPSHLVEDLEVLKQKAAVEKNLCRVLRVTPSNQTCGYILIHSYPYMQAPPLNHELLDSECKSDETEEGATKISSDQNLFLHDFALDPQFSGKGLGSQAINRLVGIAIEEGYTSITLIAVQSSTGFWERNGFTIAETTKDISSYGQEAELMVRILK